MEEGVLIKIGADAKEFLQSLSDVGSGTESFGDQLKAVGQAASVAFIALAADITASVYAYRQQEVVGEQINNIIQSTGGIAGVTAQQVEELAKSLSSVSTFSTVAVEQGEKILLTFTQIGQDTFPQAIKTSVDLAATLGIDVPEAARILGRALEAPDKATRSLRQANIFLTDAEQAQITTMIQHNDRAGAQALILERVRQTTEGMAEATAQGTGVFIQLGVQVKELYEDMGNALAPALEVVVADMKDLVIWVRNNEGLVQFGAWATLAATAVVGLIAGTAALVAGFGILSGVVATTGAILAAIAGSIALPAVAIAGLLAGLVLLAGNWDAVWPAMLNVFHAFVDKIGQAFGGLWKILTATWDSAGLSQMKEGAAQMKEAFTEGWKQAKGPEDAVAESTQKMSDALKKAGQADRQLAMENQRIGAQQRLDEQARTDNLLGAQADAALKSRILALQGHSDEVVALKKQEGDLLGQLATSQNATERALLQKKIAETRQDYLALRDAEVGDTKASATATALAAAIGNDKIFADRKKTLTDLAVLAKSADGDELQEINRQIAAIQAAWNAHEATRIKKTQSFETEILAKNKAYMAMSEQGQADFRKRNESKLLDGYDTEEDISKKHLDKELQIQIAAHNLFLEDEQKYGAAYATIDKALHDGDVQRADKGFSDLSQLTQSSNSTLKTIGQVAASEQIVIKTAQSAMDIFAGFSTIPIIGPELGLVAAAAAIAYGAEQINKVWAASEGGMYSGGISGQDSILTMTHPGETQVPSQNYEEMIKGVIQQRGYSQQNQGAGGGGGSGQGGGQTNVVISFQGSASKILTAQINQDKALGRYRGSS